MDFFFGDYLVKIPSEHLHPGPFTLRLLTLWCFIYTLLVVSVSQRTESVLGVLRACVHILCICSKAPDELFRECYIIDQLIANRPVMFVCWQVFHDIAYKAKDRQDLLAGIDEFLDEVIVLPPGEWDPNIRIEPPKSLPSSEKRFGLIH